jgi:murein DD-endopeptidase MepM/ murein hydrolase activator NlpD
VASHRAEKRAVVRRRSVDAGTPSEAATRTAKPGAHALVRPARPRRRLPAVLSAPSVVGVAALSLAAAGTLTAGSSEAGASSLSDRVSTVSALGAPATVLGGVSTDTSVLTGRQRAVSRDSQRDALEDAADQDLQQAAEQQAKERNAALAALAASAEKQAGLLAKDAWQLPVVHGVYHLTSRFGECSGLWSHCHTGLDFAAPSGAPIHAIANGTITEVGSAGAYGNRTVQTLEDGTELWYCHQTSFAVTTGQKVVAGQVIGAVGSTGNTTGPHVHVEVRPGAGDPVDPYAAMVAHGLKP